MSSMIPLLLLPLEGLYRLALRCWRAYFKTFRAPVGLGRPAIKVGNLTLGGTGKTPFVIYLARLLKKRRLQPVVLSRGYGRAGAGVLKVSGFQGPEIAVAASGDEPWLIAEQARCSVFVCSDRRTAARAALQECPHATFILDDAYQQIGIHADVNLLLIDATCPFDNGHVLPAGKLREPLAQISRADGIVVTRADHPFDQDWLIDILKEHNPGAPLFFAYNEVVGLQEVPGGPWLDARRLRGRSVILMCGIANPSLFEFDIAHQQMSVRQRQFFPDHHCYVQSDIDRVLRQAEACGAELIVTTEKDAVKLGGLKVPPQKIYALGIETRVDEEENFTEYLKTFIDL
ncbi:MAG: tetraacyldisaccharide 4'-kinase [Acidobacteria bacterium]|nr:tetraacyldisaccharide 4'-kinase [Acidobacteriota bacterium]